MNKIAIEDYLIADGVSTALKGFGYLVTAIANYEQGSSMTKFIYPMVAKLHNSTPSRAERAIRHAITKAKYNNQANNGEYISLAKLMIERR